MSKARISLLLILVSVMIASVLLSIPYSPAVPVRTARVETGAFAETYLLSGTVGYDQEQILFTPLEGVVDRIHVFVGRSVQKGDLIFRLDTSHAEAMLAELTAMNFQYETMVRKLDPSMQMLAQMQNDEKREARQRLLTQIEGSQIRSEMNGTVDRLFLREGQLVNAASAVGRIRSNQKCVWVAADGQKTLSEGTAAVIRKNGVCVGTAVYSEESAATDRFSFIPVDDCLLEMNEGERVTVEVLEKAASHRALLPLAAVSSENEVWIVEDGRIQPVEIDVSERNDSYVALPDEWNGKTVVLLPDSYDLTPGCAVKEQNV